MAQPSDAGILVDYHTHPMRTTEDLPASVHETHFRASMESYADRAATLGLAELGFSEHIYRLSIAPGVVPWKHNLRGDIGAYVSAVQSVQRRQADKIAAGEAVPVIRLAMEVDIVPSTVSLLERALPLYPFDYVLGSVHEVPDLPAGAPVEEMYRGYYATMQWGARSGLFQTIAHPDRVHRKAAVVESSFLDDLMRETAGALARHGVAVEMSSAGVRSGHAGIDPHATFVRACREAGVAITMGSDGHKLEAIGEGLPELRDLAWDAGYREIATFDRGQRVMRPLQAPVAAAVAG
jgi:histidinol-phosphatase (PHP family)